MTAWVTDEVRTLIDLALREDIGSGDVTTLTCIEPDRMAEGRFIARKDGVLAGVELLPVLFENRGGVAQLKLYKASGDPITSGAAVAFVRGPAATLLEAERTTLNFLQRLSGVATSARQYADAVAGTGCRVLDTRKTTPGFRHLEKMATAAGGVVNHRKGLFDAILIKNNHITAAGGVRAALERCKGTSLPVEIEVRTREELDEALASGARNLLLDNLTPAEASEWIRHIDGRASVELSGNIDLGTVRAYAETGAQFVSCGAITHQARSLNFNFRIELI